MGAVKILLMNGIFNQTNEDRHQQFSDFEVVNNWIETSNIGHVVSRVLPPHPPGGLAILVEGIDVMATSNTHGKDIYGKFVDFVMSCLNP